MELYGKFYTYKKRDYDLKLQKTIEEVIEKFPKIKQNPLMMLGKIQSGKTRSFIGVISLAFDNEYNLAIVLTKNSNALVKQTISRMEDEFKYFIETDEIDVFDVMKIPDNLTKFELNKKLIIVVKKQKDNLPRLINFMEKYSLIVGNKFLVIDDEADNASVGFSKDRETEEFSLRKIASLINELRNKIICNFIQVTATPYSLYLQPEEYDNLHETEYIKAIKPAETVIVPHGDNYIGGDFYFNDDVNPNKDLLFYSIDDRELDIIKSSDRRKLREEEALHSKVIPGFIDAIMNFIVGGCIRIIQNEESGDIANNKFSFIMHTEVKKASHNRQVNLLNEIIKQIESEIDEKSDFIEALIVKAYKSLEKEVVAYNYKIPDYIMVRDKVFNALKSEWVSRIVVNSDNDLEILLNSSGQLKLRTPLTIFIGGSILDRGITVSNMIGFYYGRRPQKSQQDTVLQHSRMFGYRSLEDISVTKFYTTNDLYDRMTKINEFDTKLREDFENGKFDNGVIFICKSDGNKITHCSPNKIMLSKTKVIKSGQRILPYGFSTKYNTNIMKTIKKIDDIIIAKNNSLVGEFQIDKETAIKIVDLIYDTIIQESENMVDKESFLSLIKYLSNSSVHIVSRTGRRIKKHRESRLYSDMPDNRDGDLKPARRLAINEPALMLLKQKGLKDDGWKDAEFWWPILVVQQNTATSVYAADTDK